MLRISITISLFPHTKRNAYFVCIYQSIDTWFTHKIIEILLTKCFLASWYLAPFYSSSPNDIIYVCFNPSTNCKPYISTLLNHHKASIFKILKGIKLRNNSILKILNVFVYVEMTLYHELNKRRQDTPYNLWNIE